MNNPTLEDLWRESWRKVIRVTTVGLYIRVRDVMQERMRRVKREVEEALNEKVQGH